GLPPRADDRGGGWRLPRDGRAGGPGRRPGLRQVPGRGGPGLGGEPGRPEAVPGGPPAPARAHRGRAAGELSAAMEIQGETLGPETCRLCGGVGWVVESADGRKQAHPCVCRGATIARARLDAAGIPQRYRDCTLENFSDNHVSLTRARSAAREFVDTYPAVE